MAKFRVIVILECRRCSTFVSVSLFFSLFATSRWSCLIKEPVWFSSLDMGHQHLNYLTKSNRYIAVSVTRLGKISPLWQNFKHLWLFLVDWQNMKPTLVYFYNVGRISLLSRAKCRINNTAIWSHWLRYAIVFGK